ncbi:MAG: HAD family hydrolase [Candidatus Thermoplasmatota archaeon]|nr:HAD family hydrolase [Candidatus Thermoplasmatota archaeon]MBS3789842.1 HAD family hydrolase [Candidatus Thermoplasmatota archaeon]
MRKEKEIEVISFDMDGTLIPKDFADDFWLKKIPHLYSQKTSLPKKEARERFIEEYDEMGRDDIRWYEPEYWFSKYELEQEPREVLEKLRTKYELYDDAKEVIKKLHEKYSLIIISNGIKMFIEVGLGGFQTYFTALYSSVSDFRMSKKTPCLYREICKKLDVEPEKVIHVGDDRENDHVPAKKAGMRSYLVSRNEKNNNELNDLRELLEIL